MNKEFIGLMVVRKNDKENDVAIRKDLSDEVLGDIFADLTLTLNALRPGALQIASEILERSNK